MRRADGGLMAAKPVYREDPHAASPRRFQLAPQARPPHNLSALLQNRGLINQTT